MKFFLMKMNSVIVFGLIFITIIDSGRHFSSSEQIYNLEKFISKKYFEKYDILMESKFNSFIEGESPYYLSEVLQENNFATPASSVLLQNVVGEGSHRRLYSYLRFGVRPELESNLTRQSCFVVLIVRLPSGVFADPFELQHLVQRGGRQLSEPFVNQVAHILARSCMNRRGNAVFVDTIPIILEKFCTLIAYPAGGKYFQPVLFTGAAVFGDTNLELPTFQSNRSVVEIHMDVASKVFSSNKDELGVEFEVPLHARYQPLGLGFSRVEFGQPDVFMCCSVERNAQNRSCSIMPTDCNFNSPLVWDIPCGVREHTGFVSIATFLSAVVAVLFIVLASVCYSDNFFSDKLKHL